MRNNLFIILWISAAVWLTSCGGQTSRQQEARDTVAFRYAERISVVRHQDYTEVTLAHPWKVGKVLHRYYLVPKNNTGGQTPCALLEGTVVRVPLERSVVFTTVHCALLQMLHEEQRIAGVADLKYIKVPYVHEQVRQGRIADCGEGMAPNIEKIIDLHPDAIFLSHLLMHVRYLDIFQVGDTGNALFFVQHLQQGTMHRGEYHAALQGYTNHRALQNYTGGLTPCVVFRHQQVAMQHLPGFPGMGQRHLRIVFVAYHTDTLGITKGHGIARLLLRGRLSPARSKPHRGTDP